MSFSQLQHDEMNTFYEIAKIEISLIEHGSSAILPIVHFGVVRAAPTRAVEAYPLGYQLPRATRGS